MIHVNNFSNGALNPALSYVVSCVGCFLGLRCTTRARACQGPARARWLTLAALSIGTTGIWVMHFIAMLGFTIPGETIRYNVPFTILSMIIAVVVVGIGVFIVGFGRAGNGPLLLGGTIIGLGVASMHYLGMGAVRVQASLTYNSALVAASAVIALSPTAAEIVEEGELMKRIGQSQAIRPEARPWQAPPAQPYQAYQPHQASREEPGPDQPGSLFRPRRPSDRSSDRSSDRR